VRVCVCVNFSQESIIELRKTKLRLYFKTTLSEFLDWIVIPNMTQYQIDSQALFIKPYYVSRLVSSFFGNAAINTSVNAREFSRIFMYVIKVALLRDVAFSCKIFPLSDIQISPISKCANIILNEIINRVFCFVSISIGNYGKWSRLKTITISIILAYFHTDRSPEGNRFNYIFLVITENNTGL